MKILIKAYTAVNLGDDLFIHILCKRYPMHQFFISAQKEYLRIFKHLPNLVINVCKKEDILKEEIKTAKKVDCVAYIGGSIFIESSIESVIRASYLGELIDANPNFYIIGANFGPYKTEEYFNYITEYIVKRAKGVSFRDKYSFDLFKQLPNVTYAPDIVFAMDLQMFITNKKEKLYNNYRDTNQKEIGISIIHHLERKKILEHYDKYDEKIIEIIQKFLKKGYKINLLGFCNKEKDDIAINELIKKLNKKDREKVDIYNYTGNILEYLELLNRQEYLIATRFHSLILGLKLGVKTTAICYSDKTINAIQDMNLNIPYFPMNKIENFKVKNIENSDIKEIMQLVKEAKNQFTYLDMMLK